MIYTINQNSWSLSFPTQFWQMYQEKMALIGEGREQRKRLLYLGTVTFLRERLDWPWGYLVWGTETLFTQKSAYGEWITDSRIELSLIKCECGKYPKTSSHISRMFVELILLPTLPLLFFTFFSFLFLFSFPFLSLLLFFPSLPSSPSFLSFLDYFFFIFVSFFLPPLPLSLLRNQFRSAQ